MILTTPFSAVFWICYICGGLSDFLDGFLAKRLNQQSSAGAKLDSIADLFFAVSISVVVIKNIKIPVWIWLFIAITALLRIIGYSIGFYKYHTLSALHTMLNKLTGTLIFLFPLLYAAFGLTASGTVVCLFALVSSAEELIITVKSKELNRDCKNIFEIN